jgi:DNA-binding CsgD family transcriptional regulator
MTNPAQAPEPRAPTGDDLEDAILRLPLPILTTDLQLRIRWQNDLARSLLGDAEDEPVGAFLQEGADLLGQRPGVVRTELVVRGRRVGIDVAIAPLGRDEPAGYLVVLHLPADAEPMPPRPRLTRRQAEVLELLANGASTQEIASRLGVADATARNHVRLLLRELGVHTRIEAVVAAWRNGWLEHDGA